MGIGKTSRVSPGISAAYATVSFILEVGLLVAAGFTAMTFLPWPPVLAILVVVIPLLAIWALALSPKAKVRWRLRTRVILIHLAYLIGSYALWLSIAHTGATQYLFWPAIMLGLSAVSIVLVLSTRGRVVPHPRPLPGGPAPVQAEELRERPRGRRAAR